MIDIQIQIHPRNVNTLQKGLKLMDEEYDKCSTLLAEAELKGFDVASLDLKTGLYNFQLT